jgi:hypothetical protein
MSLKGEALKLCPPLREVVDPDNYREEGEKYKIKSSKH